MEQCRTIWLTIWKMYACIDMKRRTRRDQGHGAGDAASEFGVVPDLEEEDDEDIFAIEKEPDTQRQKAAR